jgi:5-methylcytosine-specific restriction endonuclease McrA
MLSESILPGCVKAQADPVLKAKTGRRTMISRSKNSLAQLSNHEFLQQLDALIKKEKQITLKVLHYLIEMDRRGLYANMGYASMFEYCTRHLGYSESGANRRIRAARCIRDFPEVCEMLEKNELDLCKAARIYGTLTDENKSELLPEIRNHSYRQTEEILARYNPKNLLRDRVRLVYIKRPVHVSTNVTSNTMSAVTKNDRIFTANVGGKKSSGCKTLAEPRQILEKKFKLEFAVNPEVMAKIEQVKALLSTKFPTGVEFEKLFDILLNEYLERHSPERKLERRRQRKARQELPAKRKQSATNNRPKTKNQAIKSNRHIPAAIQEAVYTRDNGRCAFISPAGTKCNSTWNLQLDHIVPFARGGDHSLSNLRLLCARHNKLEAEKAYGTTFIKNKINKHRPCRE